MKCINCGYDMGDLHVYLDDKNTGGDIEKAEVGCSECGTQFELTNEGNGGMRVHMLEETRPPLEPTEEEINAKPDKTDMSSQGSKMVVMDPNGERGKPYENSAGALIWKPGDKT
jgi:hypothetical protein